MSTASQSSVCLEQAACGQVRRRRSRLLALAGVLALPTLNACGGMNRAVGVLPTTLDTLERQTATDRDMTADEAGGQR